MRFSKSLPPKKNIVIPSSRNRNCDCKRQKRSLPPPPLFVGEIPIAFQVTSKRCSVTFFDVSNFSYERGNREYWDLVSRSRASSCFASISFACRWRSSSFTLFARISRWVVQHTGTRRSIDVWSRIWNAEMIGFYTRIIKRTAANGFR